MKTKYIRLFTLILPTLLLFAACEETDERTVFPQSTPVVESASITPTAFVYGDSVSFAAKVSDPKTPLSTIEVKMIVNKKVITREVFRTPGQSTEVTAKVHAMFVDSLPDNATVDVELSLINVEGDKTVHKVEGITGKRTPYEKLYLVLDNGDVKELLPEADAPDKYAVDVNLKNSVRYKIAQKITEDKQIDFTAHVWGMLDGEIRIVDQAGDYITTSEPMKKSTERFIFDAYAFRTTLEGEDLMKAENFELTQFTEEITEETEKYLQGNFYVEKDQEIGLSSDFADVVFNMDYFERLSTDKVKFLGETGPIVLDYNPTRKYMLVQEVDPSYPSALLVSGEGLGYPSKVKPEATSGWGFDRISQYMLFRKIADNTYQGTVYMDADMANFKFFENKNWANEKLSDDYKLPGILINSETKSEGKDINGNWFAAPTATSGYYKIVINLNSKEVTATEVSLP